MKWKNLHQSFVLPTNATADDWRTWSGDSTAKYATFVSIYTLVMMGIDMKHAMGRFLDGSMISSHK